MMQQHRNILLVARATYKQLALARPCAAPYVHPMLVKRVRTTAGDLSSRPAVAVRVVCRAAAGTAAPSPSSTKDNKLWNKRSLWTAVDVVALLGSVAGALAALLGWVSPTYALTLPLLLPVISLIAALQREDLTNEEGRQYLSQLSSASLSGNDSTRLLRDAAAAIEEVRLELRSQSGAVGRLSALEDKLAVLEGAVVGAARNSREAAMGVSTLGQVLQQQGPAAAMAQGPMLQQTAQLVAGVVSAEVMPLVRAELASQLGPWLADSNAALARLDTRLAIVEGSLSGLEQAQGEGLRRLSATLNSSINGTNSTLQNSVRVELATAVEPLKQLPQLVTAAAAKAAAAAAQQQQQVVSHAPEGQAMPHAAATAAADGIGFSSPAAAGGVSLSLPLDELRELVATEVSEATQQILGQQGDILTRLSQPPSPTPLADGQWEALGRRLARLEQLIQAVPDLGQQAMAAQVAPVLAAQQAAAQAQSGIAAGVAATNSQLQQGYQQIATLSEELGNLQGRLDNATAQLLSASADQGTETSTKAEQLVQQVQQGVLQLIEQQSWQQTQQQGKDAGQQDSQQLQQGFAATSEQLRSLQQQVQQLTDALQQLQADLRQQVQIDASQFAVAQFSNSSDIGTSYGANAGGGPAAATAALAAVDGIAAVRQVLSAIERACQNLQLQVTSLAEQTAAQSNTLQTLVSRQTAVAVAGDGSSTGDDGASSNGVSSDSEVLQLLQQQLESSSSQLSFELSESLSGLCSNVQQQVQELQQQVMAVAAAAAAQAVAEATAALPSAAAAAQNSSQQLADMGQFSAYSPATAHQSMLSASNQQIDVPDVQIGTEGTGHSSDEEQWPHEQQQQLPLSGSNVLQEPYGAAGMEQFQQPNQLAPSPAWQELRNQLPDVGTGDIYSDGQPFAAATSLPAADSATAAAASIAAMPYAQQQADAGAATSVASPAATGQTENVQQQPSTNSPPALDIPNIQTLSGEQLRTEGLRLLRTGRDATRGTGSFTTSGPDFAAAEGLLQAAVACFSTAVESEPQDTRALGNLGNALLAQGELKKALLDELRLSASQEGLGLAALAGAQSLELADMHLRSEASALLTRAGEIFRRVLEVDGWSSRALVNWGKAMVGRAELAVDQQAAKKLYNAAIDKYEAVLEEEPGMVVAKYRCALAMQGLANLSILVSASAGSAGGSNGTSVRQRVTLLNDAVAYLSDVVSVDAGGDVGLRAAAAAALRQLQEQLEQAQLGV